MSAGSSSFLRPLTIKYGSTEYSVLVSSEKWAAAEQLREQFQAAPWTSQFSADEAPAADGQDGGLAQIELAARFLKFAAEQHPSHDQALDTVGVVSLLFDDFCDHFMKGNDIHVVTADLLLPARKVVINAYFTALVALQRSGSFSHSVAQKPVDSALFRHSKDGRVKLFAVFGGQGNIEDYFEETKEVFDIYRPLVYDFVVAISDHLSSLARIFDFQSTLTKGLDIMHWLTTPDTKPDLQYLISAPVSLPVIGFTQLLHLLVLAKVLGIQPGDVAAQFQGATGHSQGIVSSVVLATSTDYDSYLNNSKRALSLLFAIGNRAQQVFPQTVLNPSILEDSVSNSEGNPSPMLAVSNLRINEVTKHVEATNSHLPEDRKIEISLHNGPRSYVCCGPPQSLYGLNLALRKLKAPSGADQGRVPHSQRKLKFTSRFLPITAPFHSKYLAAAPPLILDDAKRLCCLFDSSELRLPVFSTADGSDLRAINGDITASIINMICLQPVNWPLATAMEGLTHIADFGPAGLSGVGRLTHRNKEGTGVRVILAGALEGVGPELSDKGGLFDTRDSAVHLASNWARDFAPRLVRTTCDGRIHIDSPMSRLLGKPTVMVAGMTPSTISEKFVAATMNAGYHIELSGGGHFTAQMLRDKVDKIMALVSPGLGVTLNSIYINPAQWNMQFPLIQQMRREGIPMEGLCIGAGVPTLDVANEIVQSLQSVGIAHIGFKPGTVGAIRQVIAIAQNNPTMSIILEWTGGRAGGHHSFEDFHQPILETYGAIRNQPNIVLVAGSGFGGVEDTVPYLTGEWSVKFDCAPMPFDGILFGSRVMVAKEGQADDAVKQAIVDAPGVDDADWEKTYKGPTGGIVTVNSELGEPIHKIATRGVMLWKEFDDTIFSLPRDKRLAVINAKKDYIIRRLNADFQKPYFGRKLDGTAVDVDRMTYAEVVYRLVDLMYIARQKRWIDVTLRDFVGDFLRRVEERFSDSVHESLLKSYDELQDPTGTVERVLDAYPESHVQLLTTEDVDFFVNLCRRPFQKPVPFIPLLDKEFDFWFKKDSLWQSEDLDAVIDSDVGRVCILQGPVAVRHSTKMNVPIKEMLDEIYEGQIRALKERYYDSDDSKVPAVPYLGARPTTTGSRQPEKTRVYIVPNSPSSGSPSIDTDKWLNTIAGPEFSWLRALLTSDIVVQGKRFVSNMAKRVLRPRPGQRVTVELDAETGEPAQLAIDDKDGLRAVEVRITSNNIILFTINHVADGRVCPLELQFRYVPEKPFALIHEIMEGSNDRVKEFYLKVWFGDKVSRDIIKIDDMHYQFTYRGQTVDRKDIIKFCQTVGNQSERYVDREQEFVYAPMDFAIRVGWIPIIQAIFPKFLDGDILKLVHLSNGFRMVDGAEPLRSGDVVDTVVQITGITNLPSGKRVNVKGELLRDGKPVIEVKSAFLYRGDFRDYDLTFQTTEETPIQVTYATSKDIAVLKSKEWFIPHEHTQHELVPGSKLVFRLETTATFRDAETYSHITTKGKVMMQVSTKAYEEIAVVDYECGESRGNPVIEYLTRVGHPIEQAHYFENGGYSVMPSSNQLSSVVHAPANNEAYSLISGDLNPIHTNSYLADYADLPGTITHGMWTSASTRKFVETFAAENHPERIVSYEVDFLGMVLPGDRLETKLYHVGMKNGCKLIRVETINQNSEKIIHGFAEVDQPVTAYTFTGQGSQEQGMGMDLYARSEVARAIWDAADSHMLKAYGFSILDIVRNNPREKTIYFGGPKGAKIRENYRSMTYDTVDSDGNIRSLPLFPEIKEDSAFYTFKSPNGLLSSTQFTQPALLLFELAAFTDMQSKELVQQRAPFAGHSLGEYGALSAVGKFVPVESVVEIGFYRGMTMQVAVERDELNRSQYGMVATNPARVGKGFGEEALKYVVDSIRHHAKGLLEIVNYNVENWQYVVSGELRLLSVLSDVLSYLNMQKIDLSKLIQEMPIEKVQEKLAAIISECAEKADKIIARDGFINLERGKATIPLPGIDVPFHSSFLLPGVGPFRNFLLRKMNITDIDLSRLRHLYIPNLTAKPFDITREYFEEVYDLTQSSRVAKVLREWDDEWLSSPGEQQRLAYTLLVELLAYQFASPVRWIETQDQLFKRYNIERFIEIGPAPTLINMAARTLKFKYEAYDDAMTRRRTNLCYIKDEKELYYAYDPEPEPTGEGSAGQESSSSSDAAAPAVAAVVAAPVPAATPAATAASAEIPDTPVSAKEILHAVVAQKLKKSLDEVPISKSIRDLVGGKSTLQNEILGDLQKEFGNAVPEKSEETPLDELAESIAGFSGQLGKFTSNQVSRLISGKMPGGFSLVTAKAHLKKAYGLGPARADGLLLVGLTMEPASRLGSEDDAKAWLDKVAQEYAKRAGITYSAATAGAAGGAAGGAVAAVINSAEFEEAQRKQVSLVRSQLAALAKYLDLDLRAGDRAFEAKKIESDMLQAELDLWMAEHGEAYANGIKPSFEPLKARHFDSYWNWSRQDALVLYYEILFGKTTEVDRQVTSRAIHLMNRANETLLRYMKYRLDNTDVTKGESYKRAHDLGLMLYENCREALSHSPVYKDVGYPTGPNTTITADGDIVYREVNREGERKLLDYVKKMSEGSHLTEFSNRQTIQQSLSKVYKMIKQQDKIKKAHKQAVKTMYAEILHSLSMSSKVLENTSQGGSKVARRRSVTSAFANDEAAANGLAKKTPAKERIPFLHLKHKLSTGDWEYSPKLTSMYLEVLTDICKNGLTFENKYVLITGCGKGSIGAEILCGVLAGGAKVIVTTSRYSREAIEYYQGIYQRYGAKGSSLIVVPFNQGSQQDVNALINYIYDTDPRNGLGWDLDFVIPFAAIPERGREISDLDSLSELSHRVMLTNLLRMLGEIKTQKQKRGYDTRPAQVILPLSPNHGIFGSDGLYSESKISLETLFNRWHCESWGGYLTITGAVIGWTRGTGLMNVNNVIADKVEALGVRSFSSQEMAFNILGLMHPRVSHLAENEPVWADLNGGFQFLPNLNHLFKKYHLELQESKDIKRAIAADTALDHKVVGNDHSAMYKAPTVEPRANLKFEFPECKPYEALERLSQLRGMFNLDKVVVVTGFGEVGPWGNAGTRWEMESKGEFSLEGCIELAWIMGYIKYFSGKLKNGHLYNGWVDAKAGEPVKDLDVKAKYEQSILEHTGIRLIEPELFDGYDPNKKGMMREVVLEHDMEPIDTSADEAAQFKRQNGDKVDVWEVDGSWKVRFLKGATLMVPKALRFDRLVAGQIPTGWSAERYGIPKEIINQVDPVTLYALVSTAEALIRSGITDPYEFYRYVHVSEVGNSSGSGVGGMKAYRLMYKDRFFDKDIQKDILQETFINTMAAWVNMLMLSSSGPIKPCVGACATAAISVEIAVDTIQSGKAKILLAGGYDDFHEEGSYEFANMKATSSSLEEFARGRTPREMSRPTTTTRAGFMEAQGSGSAVLMSASVAIEMGVPIYGIIALTNTATDKEGRSVPAPGQGILTSAREQSGKFPSPLLDINYRRRQLEQRRHAINQWVESEYEMLRAEVDSLKQTGSFESDEQEHEFIRERTEFIQKEATRQEKDAQDMWANEFWHRDPRIAPLRGALATYGLTINDIDIASFHGTSTKANDKNESSVINEQFKHLGRTPGNVCMAICQKYLTGHPKGAAAAWMLNGVIQSILSGIVPGNRNADNVSAELEKFEYILYPSRSIQTDGLKAGLLKSFGFGQVGAEILVIHPDYVLASLERAQYEDYARRVRERQAKAYRHYHNALTGQSPFIHVKTEAPYTEAQQNDVYLNPAARMIYDDAASKYKFKETNQHPSTATNADVEFTRRILESLTATDAKGGEGSGNRGVGVDVELVSSINVDNENFVERNFTPAEVQYCRAQPDPRASFAGKWCAKEAVVKAVSSLDTKAEKVWTQGAAAPLNEIEVMAGSSGAPEVVLHGSAKQAVAKTGVTDIKVSISHSGSYAVSVAIAK